MGTAKRPKQNSTKNQQKRIAEKTSLPAGGIKIELMPQDRPGRALLLCTVCTVIAIAAAIAYWPVHTFSFVNFDDITYITLNSHIKDGITWEGIKWAFTSQSVTNELPMWHPVTWLSLMVDYSLFGMNSAGYHIENVVLHILNSLLVLFLLLKMTGRVLPCAAAALIFAMHPLHVESVVWVTERKDVLSTFLGLLSAYAFLLYLDRKKIPVYAVSIVLFALSLLAKPMLVTLPFVLLLFDIWPLKRLDLKNIRALVMEKLPFFVTSFVFSVAAYISQGSTMATTVVSVSLGQKIANTLLNIALFFRKFFIPHDLSVLYPVPFPVNPFHVFIATVVLAVVTAGVLLLRKNHPYLLVGWLFYAGTIFPVAGIVQMGHQSCADRYTYIPMLGLIIMLCWGIYSLLSNLRDRNILTVKGRDIAFVLIFAVIAIVSGISTNLYARHWENSETLMRHALQVNPDNPMAHWYLGRHYLAIGEIDSSIESTKETLRINPDLTLYGYLGMQLFERQKYEEALKYFNEGYRRTPNDPVIVNGIGLSYLNLGKYEEAVKYFTMALQLSPDNKPIQNNLALALKMKNDGGAW